MGNGLKGDGSNGNIGERILAGGEEAGMTGVCENRERTAMGFKPSKRETSPMNHKDYIWLPEQRNKGVARSPPVDGKRNRRGDFKGSARPKGNIRRRTLARVSGEKRGGGRDWG